ncbi:MAG: PQQ-binding-like beta-propeller repeat protein [Spirochaetales bacterium]|nr:PQQ-binding-like beta-propeller repeat protein [Spirochaetales bacterium]
MKHKSLQTMHNMAILILATLSLCMSCVMFSKTGIDSATSSSQLPTVDSAWRIPLQAAEVEYAELLDDHSVFMITMRVTGFAQKWGLERHEIVLADIATGNLIWRQDIGKLPSGIDNVYSDKNLLFFSGFDKKKKVQYLSALDRKQGSLVWSIKLPASFSLVFNESSGLFLAAGKDDDDFRIIASESSTGKLVWERELGSTFDRSKDPGCFLEAMDENLLIIGTDAAIVRIRDGKTLWSTELPPELGKNSKTSISGKQLLMSAAGKLAVFSLETGRQIWNFEIPVSMIVAQIVADNKVFLVSEEGDGTCLLSALNRADGALSWQNKIDETLRSSLYHYSNAVYMSTPQHILAFTAVNGKKQYEAEIPPFLHNRYVLPDQMRIHEGLVIVARERGIAAFSADTLKLRYAHTVQGTGMYTFHTASQRLLMRQLARKGNKEGFDGKALMGELERQVIRNNTGANPDLANTQFIPRTQNQSLAEMTMAMANMTLGIIEIGIIFREEAVAMNMAVNDLEIAAAIGVHGISMQHDYYLRPYHRDGWGLTLVRLADGSRCDLPVSSPCEPLLINSGNFPAFFINPETNTLVVNGTGGQIYGNEMYEKVGVGKDVYKMWPGIPPSWKIPYRSLFGFDLDKLDFRSADKAEAAPPVHALGEKEQRLRDAILCRNAKDVKKLLKDGADVNAIDEAGFNSLFYAAMADNRKIAKILVAAGADATLRDHHGLLAYHYTFFTYGKNKSTEVFRQANMKQMKKKKA